MNTIGHREGTQRLDLAIFQKDFNFSAITPLFTPFSTTSNHHISSKNTHSTTRRVDFLVVFISHSIEKWVNTSLSSCAREIYPFKPQLQCTIPTLQNAIFHLATNRLTSPKNAKSSFMLVPSCIWTKGRGQPKS
jgi:hypothetical protein